MDKILGENWDLNYRFGGSISFGFLNKPTKIILLIFQNLSRILQMSEIFKNGPSKICGRQPMKNLK